MTSPIILEKQRHGEIARRAEDAAAVAELDAKDAALLERLPPAMVGARIRDELRRDVREDDARRRPWVIAPALAAAAVIAVVVIVPRGGADVVAVNDPVVVADGVDAGGGDRLKGQAPGLDVQVQDGGAVRPLSPGELVGSGTRVQLRIKAAGARHGVVVSVDGGGHVTRHFPDGTDTRLPQGTAALPFSFELDDAPGFERFFLVTAAEPIDVVAVTEAATALAEGGVEAQAKGLSLPGGLHQADVVVLKKP